MTVLPNGYTTLLDLATRSDPNGKIQKVVEALKATDEILDDIMFIEGNLKNGHSTSVRTGLPEVFFRQFYGRIQPSKSRYAQITDTCAMMEGYSEVDKKLADLNGGEKSEFRRQEDMGFLQAFNNKLAHNLFYGNLMVNPESFTGMSLRYNDLSAENGIDNIIDAQGSGSDNNSVWLICWGSETIHGIVPQGSKAGFQMNNLGRQTSENSEGLMEVYRTHFMWDVGLTVRDWRYAVRIANIDKSELTADASGGAKLIQLMTQAIERLPDTVKGKPVFYVPRKVREYLRLQITEKVVNSTLSLEDIAGRRVVAFDGIPVRRCDALSADEARVT